LPEVSLVAILDADKEGFLRSERSLIQTIGRAARNSNGLVILYADRVTDSMKKAMDETRRRRVIQEENNKRTGMIPTTIQKKIAESIHADGEWQGGSGLWNQDSSEKRKQIKSIQNLQTEVENKLLDYVDELSRADAIKQLLGSRYTGLDKLQNVIRKMEGEMKEAAKNLEFEKAAELRDVIKRVRLLSLEL